MKATLTLTPGRRRVLEAFCALSRTMPREEITFSVVSRAVGVSSQYVGNAAADLVDMGYIRDTNRTAGRYEITQAGIDRVNGAEVDKRLTKG